MSGIMELRSVLRREIPPEQRTEGRFMAYVKTSLIPGELVVASARHHWIMHVAALWKLCILVAIGVLIVVLTTPLLGTELRGSELAKANLVAASIAWGLAGVGLLQYGAFLLWMWSVEYAVTTRRVIMKSGLVRRQTFEVRLTKVETVEVRQGLRGRVLDYGTLTLTATGGSRASWRAIAKPMSFKRHMERSIEATQSDEVHEAGGGAANPKGTRRVDAADASNGPGRFRLLGVKRETAEDVELIVEANSSANAKVKGELSGVVVTEVVRL